MGRLLGRVFPRASNTLTEGDNLRLPPCAQSSRVKGEKDLEIGLSDPHSATEPMDGEVAVRDEAANCAG